jgi:uncharacterized integral membrane protein
MRWLVGVPVALLVVSFAVANRRLVSLSFDPFTQTEPSVSLQLPLWLLFFLGIFVGVLVGWAACWLAQGKWRKRAREAQAQITALQHQNETLQKRDEAEESHIVPLGSGWL